MSPWRRLAESHEEVKESERVTARVVSKTALLAVGIHEQMERLSETLEEMFGEGAGPDAPEVGKGLPHGGR